MQRACRSTDRDAALKNADDMLGEIVRVVDSNRDGKIQYEGMSFGSLAGFLYIHTSRPGADDSWCLTELQSSVSL